MTTWPRPPLVATLLLLAAVATTTPATAGPALYVVMALADGELVPRSAVPVEVGALAAVDDEVASPIASGRMRIPFTVVNAGGEVVHRGRAEALAWRRVEDPLAADHEHPPGAHETRHAPRRAGETAFVLRVPRVLGGRLVFGPPWDREIALDELLRDTAAKAEAPSGELTVLQHHGPPANRVDLLLVAEGFRAEERAAFDALAARVVEDLFALSPHAEYRNFVNVTSLFVASPEAGADHPPYDPECGLDDLACCPDPRSRQDPLADTFVATPFGASYCRQGLFRYLLVDEAAVLAAAAAAPDWDQILVIVNDPTYGGSGDLLTVVPNHLTLPYLVPHEYAHTFTRLADEYDSFFAWPPCSDVVPGAVPCEANVTDETTRERIKWAPWIADSTPVPTPEGHAEWGEAVGLFAGARYEPRTHYRPSDRGCMMKGVQLGFGAVCTQEYVRRLYAGGWGAPAAGIDLVEPGSELPPPGTVVRHGASELAVDVLQPRGGPPVEVAWTVDGVPVDGLLTAADADGVRRATLDLAPGPAGAPRRVELRVADPAPAVHPAMAGDLLVTGRAWTVVDAALPCTADARTLCLGDGRFAVTATVEPGGAAVPARVVGPRSRDAGIFGFYSADNWEILVKVLDGCRQSDHYWTLFAASTDRGFEVTVTDTWTGMVRRYPSPGGAPAPAHIDTAAFACP